MPSNTLNHDDFCRLFLDNTPMLDVRAPVEYQKGAMPGSINIPLLNDAERHQVGLRYKQAGQQKAIELGKQLLSAEKRDARMRQWLDFTRQNPQGCLYCFRGGLRSRTVQQWLQADGVAYPLVTGGFKALRNYLLRSIAETAAGLNFVILAGRTGGGKTLLLNQLPHAIDLEGLARHRGSSFGATAFDQPGNIDFENAIAVELMRHRHQANAPVFLEDEGRMIGSACVPLALRERMLNLPVVILETPLDQRVEISINAYVIDLLHMYQSQRGEQAGLRAFEQHHRQSLAKIVKRFGGNNYNITLELFKQAFHLQTTQNSFEGYIPLIEKLLCEYYDPMYDYQIKKKQRSVLFRGDAKAILAWAQALVVSPAVDAS